MKPLSKNEIENRKKLEFEVMQEIGYPPKTDAKTYAVYFVGVGCGCWIINCIVSALIAPRIGEQLISNTHLGIISALVVGAVAYICRREEERIYYKRLESLLPTQTDKNPCAPVNNEGELQYLGHNEMLYRGKIIRKRGVDYFVGNGKQPYISLEVAKSAIDRGEC